MGAVVLNPAMAPLHGSYRPMRARIAGTILLFSIVLGGLLAPQAHILWMQIDGQMSMDMHHAEEAAHTDGISWSAPVDCAEECPILALISGQSQAAGVASVHLALPDARHSVFGDVQRSGHSRTDVVVQVRGPPIG